MGMLIRRLYFMALSFAIISCESNDGFEITGTNPEGTEVTIVKLMGEETTEIDTLDLDENGSFVFAGTAEKPTILVFSFDIGYRVPVVLKTGKEKINFSIDDPKGYGLYNISGSEKDDRLQLLPNYMMDC